MLPIFLSHAIATNLLPNLLYYNNTSLEIQEDSACLDDKWGYTHTYNV